jgi:hypothetical protein
MRSLVAAVVAAISLSGCVSIADHAQPQRLPIVDFHTHLNGDMEAVRREGLWLITGFMFPMLLALVNVARAAPDPFRPARLTGASARRSIGRVGTVGSRPALSAL